MNNDNLFDSIIAFEQSYEIIYKKIINDLENKNTEENENLYIDHICFLKKIINFTKIKYFDKNSNLHKKNHQKNDLISERDSHFKRKMRVLRLLPGELISDLEKTRINLTSAWIKNQDKNNFPILEFEQYIEKYKEYAAIVHKVFGGITVYDSLLKHEHPKASCSLIEDIFKKISTHAENENISSSSISKKVNKIFLDSALVNNEVFLNIKESVSKLFFPFQEKIIIRKEFKNFDKNIFDKLIEEIKETIQLNLKKIFCDHKLIFENYNTNLLIDTICQFFISFLLNSENYNKDFLETITKISQLRKKTFIENDTSISLNEKNIRIDIDLKNPMQILFCKMIEYVVERDLINGDLSPKNVLENWNNGIKKYFKNTSSKLSIYENRNWKLGLFGKSSLDAISIINSGLIFNQYLESEDKKSNLLSEKDLLKKFFSKINLNNIDQISTSLFEETKNNISIFFKYINS
jgi:Zn-dependent M32 family carboxypeptidase